MKYPISEQLFKIYKSEPIKILKCGLLDLNMGNVIKNKDKYILIDQEWICKEEVPTEYAIYFSIKLMFESIPNLCNLLSEEEFYIKYGITPLKRKTFNRISIDYFDKKMKFKDIDVFTNLMKNSNIRLEENIIKEYETKTIPNICNEYEQNVIPSIRDDYEKNIIPNICNGYENEIKRMQIEQINLININNQILNSLSWKITKPLRCISKLLRGGK